MPTITQLEYVLAVHRHGHFGRAAEACGVSQPTLSAQIQKAEEELGITIFARDRKPVGPTDKGRALIEQAQVVVSAHERLLRLAKGAFEQVAGELALGVIPTLAPYVVPWFLEAFVERYPLVDLSIVERPTDALLEDLHRGRLDVGLLATPVHEPSVKERVLFYDPFYVYAAPHDPILEQDEVEPSDLDGERLWLLEDGHCVRNQTVALCGVDECRPLSTVRFEAGSFETLRHLIDRSSGYTLLPETYARLLPRDRRRSQIRPFTAPTPTRAVGLAFPKSSWKSDLIDALEQTLRASVPRSLREVPDTQDVLPPLPQLSGRSRRSRT